MGKEMWCMPPMEYYSALKGDGNPALGTPWANLEDMPSEKSASHRRTDIHDPMDMRYPEKSNIEKQRADWRLPKAGERANRKWLFNRRKFQLSTMMKF